MTTFVAYPMKSDQQKRDGYLKRYTHLKADRSTWISHWDDMGKRLLPRAPRFFTSDRTRSQPSIYGHIYDNTATRSLNVLAAGLMSGMTSPARPWFKLAVPDQGLGELHSVRLWLDEVTKRMTTVFRRSNVYRVLYQMYLELGAFGTSATLLLSDEETTIRAYPLTIGEYCLQQNYKGEITTVYREFDRTVGELVEEFGYENCSKHVQHAFDSRDLEQAVTVLHVIEPRSAQERKPGSPFAVDMPWKSVYLEISNEDGGILRESGFRRMRVLTPRWQVWGGDVYGVSPGMEALGDVRQLQQEQLRKSQAIDYKTKPPLQVPARMKDRAQDSLPGGRSYFEPGSVTQVSQNGPHGGIRTAFDVDLPLSDLLVDIDDVRMRIKKSFFEDLFLMFASRPTNTNTVVEAEARRDEKFLMIGPVIERLSDEMYEPMIDITFHEMWEAGEVPPPPQELAGVDLRVEFISVLAQAQQAVGIAGTQQFMNDALTVAGSGHPEVMDNVNLDKWLRQVAQLRGVDHDLLLEEREVLALRQARAEAQQAREEVELTRQTAGAAKDLAAAPVDQDNALAQMLTQLQGSGPTGAVA